MKEQKGSQTPKSRDEDLACQELPDEMLVYDLKSHKAHCLNPTATQIWKYCDGRTTVKEMTKRLEQEMNAPVSEGLIWLALDQLGKARLLEKRVTLPAENGRVTRRQAMRKLGLAAAVALPLVTSIIAPMAVQGATCLSIGMSDPCAPAQCGAACASCMASFCTKSGNPPGVVTCQMAAVVC